MKHMSQRKGCNHAASFLNIFQGSSGEKATGTYSNTGTTYRTMPIHVPGTTLCSSDGTFFTCGTWKELYGDPAKGVKTC